VVVLWFKKGNIMSLRKIVRNAVLTIENGDVGEAIAQAELVREKH
jgi:hypothetical protein